MATHTIVGLAACVLASYIPLADAGSPAGIPQSSPATLAKRGLFPDRVSPDLGISDAELDCAAAELEAMLSGGGVPSSMRLMGKGTLSEGGWWTVHGMDDPDTGLLNLQVWKAVTVESPLRFMFRRSNAECWHMQVEGHFSGIPHDIMER